MKQECPHCRQTVTRICGTPAEWMKCPRMAVQKKPITPFGAPQPAVPANPVPTVPPTR